MLTDIVRPYDKAENSFPEAKLKVANGKEPANNPYTSKGIPLRDNYIFHSFIIPY